MKTYKNLWDDFISEDNIRKAIKNVCKHKTKRKRFKELHDNPDKYINWIRNEALNFHSDTHKPQEIYDGIQRKKRVIIVPTFREQIIHHMVVNILKSIIMKSLYEKSYGSIPGRGAHKAKKDIKKIINTDARNVKYCLKMDVKQYFKSIPRDILKKRLGEKIKDEKFLSVLYSIIDVEKEIGGIPLGFYTSQWLANWYLSDLDHYIKEVLKAKHYYRYMDDMVIFGPNKRHLHKIKEEIEKELNALGLRLKENWQIFRFVYKRSEREYGRDLDFMGFRFFRGRTILRRSIMYKASRKARRIHKKPKATIYDIRQMLSYLGWIDCTDTYGMYVEYIKPYIIFRNIKKRISRYDRKEAENGLRAA